MSASPADPRGATLATSYDEAEAHLVRCAVLGKPIAHSLSPAMHRAAYAELGLAWSYDAIEMDEQGIATFVQGMDPGHWRGLSLTMPLKRAVLSAVDTMSPVVAQLKVANTLVLAGGQRRAENTDVDGALGALAERGVSMIGSARLLGGGATAASVAYAAVLAGARSVEFLVRDPSRAAEAAKVARAAGADVTIGDIADPSATEVDLLVSTIPASAVGNAASWVGPVGAVFDVVYDPWPTPLMAAADAAGKPLVSGLDLLAHQAALQVALMTGRHVRPQVLRQAAVGALEGR